tara:strand:- start:197 stop:433 length:237 start_codon:yes stop_codon:yes gene_type:complete
MIIKNGKIYTVVNVKKGINKQSEMIVKNGQVYHKLGFSSIPSIGIAGYAQKVLSLASSSVEKIIGVARTAIDKVIGVE